MNKSYIEYFIEKYKNDIYELQLLYETFYIDHNDNNELIILRYTIFYHRQMLQYILSQLKR